MWNDERTSTANRYSREIFQHFQTEGVLFGNMKLQVEFILSLPGSNVAIERVFSLVNIMWSEENRLHVDIVKAMIIVKTHLCYQA
jgi:hypothetical protein